MQSPTPWTENQFGSIYNNYFPILFRFTLKHSKDATLSKDLAQECLIKLWQDTFMHINAGEPAILYIDEIVIK